MSECVVDMQRSICDGVGDYFFLVGLYVLSLYGFYFVRTLFEGDLHVQQFFLRDHGEDLHTEEGWI